MLDKSATAGVSTKAGKRQKFVALAENRTRNAIKAIRVIGKLGKKTPRNSTILTSKKSFGRFPRS